MTLSALSLSGIHKAYGDNRVLQGVDLTVAPGEIHALLGENGAGKSTLIKILAGVESRDSGEIRVGESVLGMDHSGHDAQSAGIAFVHQNLGLLNSLSIADNVGLYVGFPRTWRGIDRRRTRDRARSFLASTGVTADPERLVGSLAPDEKVLVAVARAFALQARTIVLDEVSSTLPEPEMRRLSEALLRTRETGVSYLFVTHRLHEVYDIADRMTILRDGAVALQDDVLAVDRSTAIEAIVGRPVETRPTRGRGGSGAEVVRAVGLSGLGVEEPLSFSIAGGEVLGMCGLVGSGTRAVARLVGGAQRPTGGTIEVDGIPLRLGSPAGLHAQGVAYVPGQRLHEGVLPNLGIRENLYPRRKSQGAFGTYGVLRAATERRRAGEQVARLQIRPGHQVDKPMRELSGGNQQKVVLGRALVGDPKLLVLEDPTAGVDVGSRQVLHDLVRTAVGAGMAVLLVSTDYDEVASEADRVLVLSQGRVLAEVTGSDLTADHLARLSHGSTTPVPTSPEGVTP